MASTDELVKKLTEGDYEYVLKNGGKNLTKTPDDLRLINVMAIGNVRVGNYNDAISYFKRALEINAQSTATLLNYSTTLIAVKKVDEAEGTLRRLLEIEPSHPVARNYLGDVLLNKRRYKEASVVFSKLDTSDGKGKFLESLYLASRMDEFVEELEKLMKTDRTNRRVAAIATFCNAKNKSVPIYPYCPDPLRFVQRKNIRDCFPGFDGFEGNLKKEMSEIGKSWEPPNKTTVAGFQSVGQNLFESSGKSIGLLKEQILLEIREYISSHKSNKEDCSFVTEWPSKLSLYGWYVTFTGKGGHQGSHIHAESWVSGVYYVKTISRPLENEGAIKFGLSGYKYANADLPESATKVIQPNDGDLVLFPSSLFHETVPVVQNEERTVIAFDLRPAV